MYFPPRTSVPPALMIQLKKEQEDLQKRINLEKFVGKIRTIAGCDSALIDERIFSVFVVFTYPELEEIEMQYSYSSLELPYIPGYLAFREVPNVVKAYHKLKHKPDITMVDGHGIMHPRRLGIATHLGIKLNIPTFGVAKKKLVGRYTEVGPHKGDTSLVEDRSEIIGAVLRSKEKVNPVFVSPGYLCDLATALELTISTLKKHKLPEPTRIADLYSKKLKGSSS